jgi:hypothetical protein
VSPAAHLARAFRREGKDDRMRIAQLEPFQWILILAVIGGAFALRVMLEKLFGS